MRVGWALRNISDRLFIVWIAFSAKDPTFDFRSIRDNLYEKWTKFDMNNPKGLTNRSIMYWSKQDAPESYRKVQISCVDFYIDQTLDMTTLNNVNSDANKNTTSKGCGDFDIATVLYHFLKYDYKCVSIKDNIWYKYRNHRWVKSDSGTQLRKSISVELRELYRIRATKYINQSGTEDTAKFTTKADKCLEIVQRLGRTNDKKNIMTEAKELFYDESFFQKLDTNPYLLCFNNGVYDFKDKMFRRGYPEDYISKTTNIDYEPIDLTKHQTTVNDINAFMKQLFPIKELHDYMWEHLASTLIGISNKQTFNMYIGAGRNGKSVLVSLMEKVLGEYKGDVPLSLVMDRRTKIGGLAPELVALKGIRYAVMQEPSKGDRINEGIMKQLTSGIDPIQARAPYMIESLTFIPQFKLAVCSNEFMEIKSQDHGTWRRIRVVDFVSLFTENPEANDPDKPYQFLVDLSIGEKFNAWKEVFAAMLVDLACKTNGNVTDCNMVLASSNSYRESQDYIAEFIRDKIIVDSTGRISKTELSSEFSIWYQSTYGKGGPSPKDVQSYMDKRFGKFEKHKAWIGARINYERDDLGNNSDFVDDVDVNDL
jgi:P4 family phage/plasmid primase-like protien